MKKKSIGILAASFLFFVFFISGGFSQQANDQYGFGERAFLIQSALEAGKSAYGFWDVPGTPRKSDGNLKGTKWLEMGVYQREKGDPDDRLFTFRPAQGNGAGKYFIYFARERNWGINYVEGTGKIEARSRADYFEIKHMGGDRWKIYVKPGYVMCVDKNTAKNGTKIVVKPDHSGNDALWVFYDLATLRSFIPAKKEKEVTVKIKMTLPEAIAGKNPSLQYFEYADDQKFLTENKNGELQAWFSSFEAQDQWSTICLVIKSVQKNGDINAKRAMLKAISEVTVKPGSGFLENTLKSTLKNEISKYADAEKDAQSKILITGIANKF